MFSVVSIKLTISFVISVVPPASVVLTLIFVKEMRGEWSLIPHVLHLFLSDVASVIISGPIAWAGLLLFLATGATDSLLVSVMVVHMPCHANIE